MRGGLAREARIGLAFLFLAAVLEQSASAQSNDEKTLVDLARSVGQAWVSHDIPTLERLIDDPYFHTNVSGRTQNRAEWLAQVPDLEPRPTISLDDVKVRVFGDTAVLTGHLVLTLLSEGKATKRAMRFTQVWRRYGDTWRRAVFQGTEVPAN